MELTEAMRTTGTCRYFRPDPVPDDVLRTAFDLARFGPQGGNRQPVRWVVVRDAATKQALADLYLPPWKAYLGAIGTGEVNVGALPRVVQDADYFAEHFASVPVVVVACAELAGLHPTDTELGRLSIVGGGSVYPTVQNFLLALRDQGVGSAFTTLLCAAEPQVRELLAIPEGFVTACHVAVGYPERPFPTKLDALARRRDRLRRVVRHPAVLVSAARQTPLGRATIGDQLRRHARTQPRKVAFVTYAPDRAELTYAELDALANRWAHLLAAHGVGRGHVVAMVARNGIPMVAAYYGALKLGASFTVVNPMFRAHEVAWQLEHAEPTVVFADPAFAELVDGALLLGPDFDAELAAHPDTEPDADVDENDVAMLVYTSGTTATPKGVLITHRNYLISTAPAWSPGWRSGPTTRGSSSCRSTRSRASAR